MTDETIVIENETLSVSISPRQGGSPHGLLHKPTHTKILTDLISPDPDGWTMAGSPFLFPFAGRVYDKKGRVNRYEIGEKVFGLPIHGFASRLPWKLLSSSPTTARLKLTFSDTTLKQFPFPFEVTNTFEIIKNRLLLKSAVTNLAPKQPMPISPGWHPFFNLEKSESILATTKAKFFEVDEQGLKGDPLPLNTALTISPASPLSLIIENPTLAHLTLNTSLKITLSPDPLFKVAVVWKPENSNFVCVEPWFGPPNMIRTPGAMLEIAPKQTTTFINSLTID